LRPVRNALTLAAPAEPRDAGLACEAGGRSEAIPGPEYIYEIFKEYLDKK